MTKHHARAARHEREAAATLGTTRVKNRPIGVSAADVLPVRTPSGHTLSVEIKNRKKLPRLILKWLAQAAGYLPSAVPAVVMRETGSRSPLILLPLEQFVEIAGIKAPAPGQLALAPSMEAEP